MPQPACLAIGGSRGSATASRRASPFCPGALCARFRAVSILLQRNILLGVTGGIAAYKAAELCRLLVKSGANVQVVMSRGACEFVQPLTFAALSRREVATDLFDAAREAQGQHHIALARWAQAIVVAPATADFLAKVAAGRADDLLSTVVLACEAPVLLAPSMNPTMLLTEVTQENLERLRTRPGITLLESPAGAMAEPEEGPGRLLEPVEIVRRLERALGPRDLVGVPVVVTAGPTREPLDPVRFLSNRSSGKMGYALAARAAARGAEVTLISGPSALRAPPRVKVVRVETTAQMRDAVLAALAAGPVLSPAPLPTEPSSQAPCEAPVLIMAAAPADYRVADVAVGKLKKGAGELVLRLVPTDDILMLVSQHKPAGAFIVGFAAETHDVVENARAKVVRKQLELCVANEVGPGRGFDVDHNRVWLVGKDGAVEGLPELPKLEVADAILDRVVCARSRPVTP